MGDSMDDNPMAKRLAEEHRQFLEQHNPSVLSGQDDPTGYLSEVGRLASESFEEQMWKFANSKEVQNLPHLERVRALQNHREAVLEQITHDYILQPVPEIAEVEQ
jgi:hypothetical protein